MAASSSALMAGFSSAFLYIANLYRNRARVSVRLLQEERPYSARSPGIKFEAENLGRTITSIEPIVRFRGFLPRPKGERPAKGFKLVPYRIEFEIDESAQRTLPPSTPITFTAVNRLSAGRELKDRLGFMFFKTYTFAFTRGGKVNVRIRSADHVVLSWKRYVFERFDFALRGVNSLPKQDGPVEWDEGD
jgi:hypothetical protein